MFQRILIWVWALPALMILAACGVNTTDEGEALSVGMPAPNFALPDAQGGDFTLANYNGQAVLLYFHMAGG